MLKRRFVGVGAVAVAVTAVLAFSGCSSSSDAGGSASNTPAADLDTSNPVILGLDADTTGPGASYGTIVSDTVKLAVDEINANGGILGREVKIAEGNDESDPTKTSTVVNKLADDGAAGIILGTGSGSVLQAKTIVKSLEIPAIGPTAITAAVGLPPDNEYTFMLANDTNDYVSAWCAAWKEKGYKKLGILADQSPAIAGVLAGIEPGLKDCIDIVAEETAPVDSTDLSAQVSRIKSSDPDVLLLLSVGGSFEVLAQNTLGTQMPDLLRFETATIGNQPDSWDLVNPGLLTQVVYMGALSADNEKTNDLIAKLKEKHGDDYQMSAYASQAYDSVYLFKEAIENAGGTDDTTKIRDGLEAVTDYEAAFGQPGFTLSFSKDKHIGADDLKGLVLSTFGDDNRPSGPWPDYQAS